MGQLEGRVALVTGGGRGIGRGIVMRFLAEKAKIVIAQRSDIDDELAQNPDIAFINADRADSSSLSPDSTMAMKTLIDLHPVGRIGEPKDIGDAAVFLAGDSSGFLTGQTIVVDGGRTIKLPLYAS